MAKSRKNKPLSKQHPTNLWDTLTSVFVTSMNKGQFPAAIIGLILVIVVSRLPPEDLSTLAFAVKNDLAKGYLLGYVISFLTTTGWFFHARWQRKIISVEMQRIGKEKSRIQTETFELGVKSSEQ
jgi:hypothetical protein